MSEQNPLAQQATTIFDEMGETAMQLFVYHARHDQSQVGLWQNAKTETLHDLSFVNLSNGHNHNAQYIFTWLDDGDQPHVVSRPASDSAPPKPPEPTYEIMQWPTTEHIQQYALMRAVKEAAQRTDPGFSLDDRPIPDLSLRNLAVMDLFAPELRKAANHEILSELCPQNAVDVLESYLDSYAEDAIKRVPKEQWHALVDHLAKQMP